MRGAPAMADLRCAANHPVAEAFSQAGEGACEVVGLHGLAETKLLGGLLEVRCAEANEADGAACVFRPGSFEEGGAGFEEFGSEMVRNSGLSR